VKDKKVAIIPARGGSRRIPKKNIKSFYGKPLIAYSIETALESNLFDRVIVSTDSKRLLKLPRSMEQRFRCDLWELGRMIYTGDRLRLLRYVLKNLDEEFGFGWHQLYWPMVPISPIPNYFH